MEVTQIARKCDFQQRSTICDRINEGVKWDVGDRNKAINGFSSTDRQTDREDKSRARTVLKNVLITGKIIGWNSWQL